MHGAVTPVIPLPGGVELDARLAITEFLLASTDLEESARQAIEWLVTHTGLRQGLLLLNDPLQSTLVLIATHGVPAGALEDFAISRTERDHPLLRAMGHPEPTYFDGSGLIQFPVDASGVHVVPLRETSPTGPAVQMLPGKIPILVRVPGVMRPGQLGPIRRTPRLRTNGMVRLMCMTGMPSVMHTTSGIPASAASITAAAAPIGGT